LNDIERTDNNASEHQGVVFATEKAAGEEPDDLLDIRGSKASLRDRLGDDEEVSNSRRRSQRICGVSNDSDESERTGNDASVHSQESAPSAASEAVVTKEDILQHEAAVEEAGGIDANEREVELDEEADPHGLEEEEDADQEQEEEDEEDDAADVARADVVIAAASDDGKSAVMTPQGHAGDSPPLSDLGHIHEQKDSPGSHLDQSVAVEAGKPARRLPGRRRAPHANPQVEAALRRQLHLRMSYRAVAKQLKPLLAELAKRTLHDLKTDALAHEKVQTFDKVKAGLEQTLKRRQKFLDVRRNLDRQKLSRSLEVEVENRKKQYKVSVLSGL